MLALVVLACTAPGSAGAQTPEESFQQGIVKFDEGDCKTALPLFEAAYQGTQSPNARLYAARCLAQLERYVDAYREMAGTLELARDKAEEEAKYAQTRNAAAAELAQLEPKVGKLVVAFDAPYEGASILVDGREIPEAEQGIPIPVAPGDVQVTARASGKEEYTRTVEVEAGESRAIAIVLEDSAPAAGDPEESDDGPGLGTLRIVGIAVAGVGVGGMVAFAVTGSMASSKFSEVEEACGGETCPDLTYVDDIDSGKTLQTVANVSLGLGIAFMVGGAAMIIFGGPSDDGDGDEGEANLELVPTIAPTLHGDRIGGATIGVTGRF